MLPVQLLGIYRQYKQDTDSVALWLASTAKAFGYQNLGQVQVQAPKSGRLKGKDRIKARRGGDGKAKEGSRPGVKKTTRHVIAIKDFLALADYIASRTDPAVSVPAVFLTTIDRLIHLRSGFGGRLSDEGLDPDPESTERHGYFVGVLSAVRETLRPRAAAFATASSNTEKDAAGDKANITAPNDSPKDEASKDLHLSNRFAALPVDEPSQAFLDAFRNAPRERPEPRDEDPVSYEAEPQTSLEDVLFAFAVLVNDLGRIRSRIEWIWSNHRDGIFDLAAAAVATNTAISVARGMIEEVAPLVDAQDRGITGVLNKFWLMSCLQKGYAVEQVYTADSKDNFNYDLYDIADQCYMVAFRLVDGFAAVLDPRQLPLVKEGIFGEYHPDSDRASKTGREKFREDKILLMEFFTELVTVIRSVPNYPVQDEFLREMKRFDKAPVVSFPLVFAAQVFLDIHHTMRGATRSSFQAMIKETSVMDNSLGRHLEFHKGLTLNHWPASNDHALRELSRIIQWMGKDPVHGAKAKVYARTGMPVPREMEAHRILIYSPVLSGLFLFRLRTEMYDVGLAVANAWGSITYTAHLYNAMQKSRLLDVPWPDMEITLSILGDSNIWVGDERPETNGDCFRKFCLQMGVSAASFTQNRRRNAAVASRAGPRGIKDGAPVSSMFGAQVCSGADVEWTPELLDDIVARSAYQLEGSADAGDLIMTQIDDPQELRAKNRLRQQKANAEAAGKGRGAAAGGLVPEELISTLVMALNCESLEMAFPYLVMHRWCWGLLRSIKDSCDPVLREIYTPAYMEKESELPWVVGYILMAAAGVDGGGPDLRLLELAAARCNAMISTEAGSLAISVARMIGKDIQFEVEGP
ncbi:hypothetical protein CTA2_4618 [Colletotrichum tanaceti]|uniref:DUF6604 domain-containing protein n=1 Tax=Colletotrichum tanaceti TaxID=1306861 RepID=A0A4U6XPI2_9PEZI|nr:hypothetical protein CTA2_4618 [Colletotrichum tanaceti]TKW57710.1 hypothetical protein CTA1_11539 [Colletotrichum tanaceti]